MSTLTIGCIKRPICYGFMGSPDSLPERKYIQSESNLYENTVCCQTGPGPAPPPPFTDIHIWRYAADPATAQNTVQLEILNPVYDPTADLLFPTTTAEGAGTRLFFDTSKGAYRAGTVTGAQWNDANRGVGSVAMGVNSTASGAQSVVSGGEFNTASGIDSFVGGGNSNTANALEAIVVGGESNTASGDYSFIGGGESNQATGIRSTIGGGNGNLASGVRSTIGGGAVSIASGVSSTVGGGEANNSGGPFPPFPPGPTVDYTTIGGGLNNVVTGLHGTIGGGAGNHAFAADSTIGGGIINNILTGALSGTIAGGSGNFIGDAGDATVQPNSATICGGSGNIARNHFDFIGGGIDNQTFSGHTVFPLVSANVIGGGSDNDIGHIAVPPNLPENNPRHCNILGGGANKLGVLAPNDVSFSTIGGGNLVFLDANHSVIGGGLGNKINPPTVAPAPVLSNDFGFIGGGDSNQIGFHPLGPGVDIPAGINNTIAGGSKKTIFNGNFVTIAGGETNRTISTLGTGNNDHDTIGGGFNNEIRTSAATDSSNSTIVGGSDGLIVDSKNATILGGDGCQINAGGDFSFAMGENAMVAATHNHSVAVGLRAAATTTTSASQFIMGFDPATLGGTQGLYWQGWPTTVGVFSPVVIDAATGQLMEFTSSQRYKKNILSVDAKTADTAISGLRPVRFESKDTNQPEIGFIAEEVFDIVPEAVALDKEGLPRSLQVIPIVAFLVKQVQELKQQVAALQQQ